MKRVVVSLVALVSLGVVGAIAIAQAQRTGESAEPRTSSAANTQPGEVPKEPLREKEPRVFVPSASSRPLSGHSEPLVPAATPIKTDSEQGFPGPNPLRAVVFPATGDQATTPSTPSPNGGGNPVRPVVPGANPSNPPAGGLSPGVADLPMLDPFGDRVREAGGAGQPPAGTRVAQNTAVAPPSTVAVPSTPGGGREPAPFQLDPSGPAGSLGAGRAAGPEASSPPGVISEPGARALPSAGPNAGVPSGSGLGGSIPPSESSSQEEGTGQPGNKVLEGPQTAQITIHKLAPSEVQVGRPAKFQIKVINTGSVAATDVELRDQIPRGARLLSTQPPAQRGVGGDLIWKLGSMAPGQEISVEMELVPTSEGEIGSVATVRCAAEASARSLATRPMLDIKVAHPQQVVIGDSVTLNITISNPGTGVAEGVVLEAHVPEGFQHPAGNELEYEVGTLRPRESRQLELILTAARPGAYDHLLMARAEGNLRTEHRQTLRVLAPQLDLNISGATRRYLEREATYQIAISNVGSAPAKAVVLSVEVPPGMKFVSADNQGYYEENTRTVSWRLAELPVQTTGTVKLTLVPQELGQKVLRMACNAERLTTIQKEHPVEIEGIVALNFQVADTADPVEKQGETTYEIRVLNQGSKTATNVQLEAIIPPEMRVVAAEGPVRHGVEESRVRFESLARLAPKAEATYRIRVQCLHPGDLRMRVHLSADDMERPVIKEESTRVYSDE